MPEIPLKRDEFALCITIDAFTISSELRVIFGEEDEAIELYEQARQSGAARLQTLVNLGVLYEDRGDLAKAEYLLKQVIDSEPNHERARLFLKDVQASRGMYVEDEVEPGAVRPDAVLEGEPQAVDLGFSPPVGARGEVALQRGRNGGFQRPVPRDEPHRRAKEGDHSALQP